MRVLGVITARGGSRGIPRKNLRPLQGKPLLQYTAEAALAARLLNDVILSTEDEEIADLGRRCGVEVPFRRPASLAQDDTPTLPVLQHAVAQLEQAGPRYDAVCLLQPTAPLRRAEQIDACIERLQQSAADCVVSVLPVPTHYNPHWVYFQDADGCLSLSTGEAAPIPQRQQLPPAYHREGSIYVVLRDVLMLENSLYGRRIVGFPIAPGESVNIDTPEDWCRAERLLQSKSRCDDANRRHSVSQTSA